MEASAFWAAGGGKDEEAGQGLPCAVLRSILGVPSWPLPWPEFSHTLQGTKLWGRLWNTFWADTCPTQIFIIIDAARKENWMCWTVSANVPLHMKNTGLPLFLLALLLILQIFYRFESFTLIILFTVSLLTQRFKIVMQLSQAFF